MAQGEAAQGETAPNETAPNETAPNETAPNEAAQGEAAPNEAAPNETASPQRGSARHYSSPLRAETAAATRRRIVGAAAELFGRQGFRATTIPAIAAAAGVSVQSVYLAGSKSSLLIAAFDLALSGDDGAGSFAENPALAAILQLPVREALPLYCEFLASANARASGVWHAMYAAAETDSEVAALLGQREKRGHDDFLEGVAYLESQGMLAGSATADERADIWDYIASPQTYRYLTGRSGWSTERYTNWLVEALLGMVVNAGGPSPLS